MLRSDGIALDRPSLQYARIPRLSSSWARPLIEKAREGGLCLDDMFQLPPDDKTWLLYLKYQENWPRFEGRQFAELKCLFSICARDLASNILFTNVAFSLEFVRAIGFRELLLTRSSGSLGQILFGVFAVALGGFLKTTLFYLANDSTNLLVGRMKAVFRLVIYNKATRISTVLNHDYNESDITVLLHNDVDRLFSPVDSITLALGVGCTIYAALTTLYDSAGATVIVMWVVLMIVMLLSVVAALIGFRERAAFRVETFRFGLLRELLKNIHIVKFYAWEIPLADVVESYRFLQLRIWRLMRMFQYLISSVLISMDDISPAVSFLVLLKLGRKLTADVAFPTVLLLYITTAPLVLAPGIVSRYAQMLSSFDRLNTFFATPEPKLSTNTHFDSQVAIRVSRGNFGWNGSRSQYTDEPRRFIVKDLNLEVRVGSFVAITGAVASGKTTLLLALRGRANLDDHSSLSILQGLKISSVLTGWSYHGSVRDNILFGSEWDSLKYETVVNQCQLEQDFAQFPDGDLSEIGDGACTLSGGQRARISLARCLYKDPDVYLLDDVLSSVDGLTANQILGELHKLVSDKSRPKTVVLATNNLKLSQYADHIVYLRGDGGYLSGTLEELMRDAAFFQKYDSSMGAPDLETDAEADSLHGCNEDTTSLVSASNSEVDWELPPAIHDVTAGTLFDPSINRRNISNRSSSNIAVDNTTVTINDDDVGGQSPWRFIKFGASYFMEPPVKPLFILSMFLTTLQCTLVVASPLLILAMVQSPTIAEQVRLGWLLILAGFAQILLRTANRSGWDLVCNAVMESIHRTSVLRLFRAPLSYHETVPLGQLMHRLNQNMTAMDYGLRLQLLFLFITTFSLLGYFALITYLDPKAGAILVTMAGLGVLYLTRNKSGVFEVFGVHSAYKVKSTSLIAEKVNGIQLVVDYNQQSNTLKQLSHALDDELVSGASMRAVTTLYCYGVSAFVLVLFVIVLLETSFNPRLSDAEVGAIVEVLRLASLWFEHNIALWQGVGELLSSVDKLGKITSSIPQEPYGCSEDVKWTPKNGSLEFRNVSFRYGPGLPLVLQNFNLKIQGQQSIGICGRTGVGKTTLINTIFRFADLCEGQIFIDDSDITTIPLKHLRNSLSIIPQQNVLFRGTVRSNLDPLSEKADEELWDALRRSGFLEATAGNIRLDSPVDAEGRNFSLGESQMIALARALVRKTRILLLDEATSAVDAEADKHIQQTIKEEFAGCTIISIAHRIQTIVKYDRVLAIGEGGFNEFGPPLQLYEKNGLFWEICEDAGIEYSDFS